MISNNGDLNLSFHIDLFCIIVVVGEIVCILSIINVHECMQMCLLYERDKCKQGSSMKNNHTKLGTRIMCIKCMGNRGILCDTIH